MLNLNDIGRIFLEHYPCFWFTWFMMLLNFKLCLSFSKFLVIISTTLLSVFKNSILLFPTLIYWRMNWYLVSLWFFFWLWGLVKLSFTLYYQNGLLLDIVTCSSWIRGFLLMNEISMTIYDNDRYYDIVELVVIIGCFWMTMSQC